MTWHLARGRRVRRAAKAVSVELQRFDLYVDSGLEPSGWEVLVELDCLCDGLAGSVFWQSNAEGLRLRRACAAGIRDLVPRVESMGEVVIAAWMRDLVVSIDLLDVPASAKRRRIGSSR